MKDNQDMKIYSQNTAQPHGLLFQYTPYFDITIHNKKGLKQCVYLECVGEFESTIFDELHSSHRVQRHSALQLTNSLHVSEIILRMKRGGEKHKNNISAAMQACNL